MLLTKKDFRENLKYVKDKKGEVIDSMTEKCSLNTQYAQVYAEALFEEIREATLERKLCLLFLIDSILRQCKRPYLELFQKGIIDAFCSAYEASKDRPEIRKELRFLFKVWELYFSHTTLSLIDASLKLKLGEDINASLSVEELDHIIAHYRKIKEDPSLLELQKTLLMKSAPPKVPKKEKKEKEESSLYVPDDIKNRLEANAGPDKKVKAIRPKPIPTDAPKQNTNGMTGVTVKKSVVGDLPPKRSEGEPKLRKPEGETMLKKVEGRPPIPKKSEGEIASKKMEVEGPLRKAEPPTAVRKLSKGDPAYTIKKKAPTRREKASIDADEQALGAKRKIIKGDQDEVKNIAEERRKPPMGIPKPPEDSRTALRRENMARTDREIPEKPIHPPGSSNLNQDSMKRFPPSQQPPRQQEQKREMEESFEAGAFSDDDDTPIPTKQPPVDTGYIRDGMNPNFHQQQHLQQPPHVQPPHMRQPGQHPHYQYQQNPQFAPQSHFQGPPRDTQSQYPRPHFRNEPVQGYPPGPGGQFQQPSQMQPFQQVHHNQGPPGHFQPQFQNQPGPNEDHGLGPGQYQNRPFNPQRQQHHGYNQFPNPYQSQEPPQGQFRPNMTTDQQMNPMNQQFGDQAPRNDGDNKLLEIRNMLMTSRRQGPEPIRPPEDFNPDLQLLSTARKDSFPDPRNFRPAPETQFYDQGSALVFRSLLQEIKRALPGSIKDKYDRRLGRMASLSEMVIRRDFNIVESLYESLPYRCSSCGMRFSNRTPLDKHLDNHLRFNMEQKEKTKTMNLREQLITTEHWIKDEGHKNYKTANVENGEDDFEFENYVPTSEDQKSCKACGETFKEVWDKDKETWLLDTATKVKYKEEEKGEEAKQKNGVSYDLMHFRCYKLCLQIESK